MEPALRCAIYTRVSTDSGLDQEFNSLDNQREAAEAYIKSQAHEGWRCLRDAYDDGGFSGGSMDRPALHQLLAAIRARRVDVVVVYKVDRLTRSLADFAKLVELFDANGVSFVSVTQAFNTTSSMGRLTLNVLLSFAQFEREVTSERIRDKIAASKRRGLWVGGMVPLGYETQNKALRIVPEEADRVRTIFRRYLELGSLGALVVDLRASGITTKVRPLSNGRTIGGIAFTRGPLAYLLHNRFYIGEVSFKGSIYPGDQPAILNRDLFEAVQDTLARQRTDHTVKKGRSGAVLVGKLVDPQGRRMTPTHATKKGVRYRYYVTAIDTGDPVHRVSAPEIEGHIIDAVRARSPDDVRTDLELIQSLVERVQLRAGTIAVELRAANPDGDRTTITLPWQPASSTRHREIIPIANHAPPRTMRAETRATLLQAIARSRVWLDEIVSGTIDLDGIAYRETCSPRQVSLTLSLAHLAPDIVEMAIAGRLPHGVGLRELRDPAMPWSRQRSAVGLG